MSNVPTFKIRVELEHQLYVAPLDGQGHPIQDRLRSATPQHLALAGYIHRDQIRKRFEEILALANVSVDMVSQLRYFFIDEFQFMDPNPSLSDEDLKRLQALLQVIVDHEGSED